MAIKDPMPLLSKLFDGSLTDTEAAELRANIKEDPQYAEQVVFAASLHSHLRDLLSGRADLCEKAADLTEAHILPALEGEEDTAVQAEAPRPLQYMVWNKPGQKMIIEKKPEIVVKKKRVGGGIPFRTLSKLAIAATVVVGVGVGVWFMLNRPSATVADLVDAQFGSGNPALNVGDVLPKEPVQLTAGFMRIAFRGGASVVVEGPATIQIDSKSKMHLDVGRLTTSVPHEAIGFTVQTPEASIVDLGTEVGINVTTGHRTHVEVFTGSAEVQVPDATGTGTADKQVLTADMAAEVPMGSKKVQIATPEPITFVRQPQMEDQKKIATVSPGWDAMVHNIWKQPDLLAYYSFSKSTASGTTVHNLAKATGAQNDAVLGSDAGWETNNRFGTAGEVGLCLRGNKDSLATLSLPGKYKKLSMAAWINVHKLNSEYGAIFETKSHEPGVIHWHLLEYKEQYRMEVAYALPNGAGQSDWQHDYFRLPNQNLLRKWHFIAFSYDSKAQEVTAWWDGKQMDSISKTLKPPSVPVSLGEGWIGYGSGGPDPAVNRALTGQIDEFGIWSRTLTDAEVSKMYRAGRPVK